MYFVNVFFVEKSHGRNLFAEQQIVISLSGNHDGH